MRIALVGNPNCGKTTLYNHLTGSRETAGNWSGVTVDSRMAKVRKKFSPSDQTITLVDLPGAYSVTPFTGEEVITRDFIMDQAPDVIINILDGANLERSLFMTTQLLELDIPMVIALNKTDTLEKRKDQLSVELLAERLGCPIVPTVATKGTGLKDLIARAIKVEDAPRALLPVADRANDEKRQELVDHMIGGALKREHKASALRMSDRLDRIFAHKWFGLPIFFLIMWGVYATAIEGIGGALSEYFNEVLFGEIIPEATAAFFATLNVAPLMQDLIIEGAIGGVGAVIGFLPLIMVLFFLLGLLEDSGYMARVAVVMDRYFKKIGLSGKSIIPMIVGSGCAIPGVMATRTIEDVNERRMTTMLTPFVPCGAKLPIIALFSAVFFPESSWVGPSMYIMAVVMIIIGGLLLKRLFRWESSSNFFIELPEYKIPSVKYAFRQMIRQAKGFIYKASTIILVMNTLIWFMQTYSWNLQVVADQGNSILASVGGVIAPLLIPLGFVGWQLAAATLTGFIAKENVVSTFAILLVVATEEALHVPGGPLTSLFTPVTAYAFLAFNLFTPPCFAAIGAMNAEMEDRKWLFRAIGFQLGMGYGLALLITQVGTILLEGRLATGFVPAVFAAALMAAYVIFSIRRNDRERLPERVVA